MLNDSFFTLITRVLVIIFNFSSLVLVSNYLGIDSFGIYSILVLIPTVIYLVSSFGVNTSCIYYLNTFLTSQKQIFGAALLLPMILCPVVFLVYWLSSIFFPKIWPSSIKSINHVEFIIFVMSFFLLAKYYFDALLQGRTKYKEFNFSTLFQASLFLLGLLLFVVMKIFSLNNVIFLWCGSIVLSVFYQFLVIYKDIGGVRIPHWSLLSKLLRFGFGAYVAQLSMVLLYRFDILMIESYLDKKDVAMYVVASRFIDMMWLVPDAFGLILFPKLTRLSSQEKIELTTTACRLLSLVSLILIIFSYLTMGFVVDLFFGKPYQLSVSCLYLLLPATLFVTYFKVISRWLFSEDKTFIAGFIAFICFFSNIILNIIMIPRYGVLGAAISSSLCYIILGLLSVYLFKLRSGNGFRSVFIPSEKEIDMITTFFRHSMRLSTYLPKNRIK